MAEMTPKIDWHIHKSKVYFYKQTVIGALYLTHLILDKMAATSQTIFYIHLSERKIFVFLLIFHWSLFLRVQLTIPHWFR